jgi:Tripartite tricarboxylate transporter family receptor
MTCFQRGGAPINDLLGGQIDILIDSLTINAPQLAAGTIRGLGVTSAQPWFSIPDVPPIATTVPGYEVRSWLGIATAKNTSQPIVDKRSGEFHGHRKSYRKKKLCVGARGQRQARCKIIAILASGAVTIKRGRALILLSSPALNRLLLVGSEGFQIHKAVNRELVGIVLSALGKRCDVRSE